VFAQEVDPGDDERRRTTMKLRRAHLGWSYLLVGLSLSGGIAIAHSNGHESRTVADCEKLPGTADSGERGACLKCVGRPVKHHYHPDYAAGNRCRPDDGKP
jgi:hypothetical protein